MADLSFPQQYQAVLQKPSPDEIIKLQNVLLALIQNEAVQKCYEITQAFYQFMVVMRAHVAQGKFDNVALGLAELQKGVSTSQNIFDPNNPYIQTPPDVLRNVYQVLDELPFVREWTPSFAMIFDGAAWGLYDYYWRMSLDLQPYLNLAERGEVLKGLFKHVFNDAGENAIKIIAMMQLYLWAFAARMYPTLQHYKSLVGG